MKLGGNSITCSNSAELKVNVLKLPDHTIYIALFLLSLAFRLIQLFKLDVWFDEVVILLLLDNSLSEIWNLCKNDNFPPLYPLLLKFWGSYFPGENSLRFFSALLGSLTPPAAYLLGKEIHSRKLGLLLGSACAISVSMIFYSQMIRMYAIFPLFGCLSLFGFFRALKTDSWKYWILIAVANLLGFYTFLFMLLLIGMQLVILPFHYQWKLKKLSKPILVHLPVFLLMLFWLVPMLNRMSTIQESFVLSPITFFDLPKLWVFFGTSTYFGGKLWVTVLLNLPFLIGIVLSLSALRRNANLRIAMIILISIVVIIFFVSYLGQSIFLKRYFLFLLPVYLAAVFIGWMQLQNRILRAIGLVTTSLVMIFSLSYYYADYCYEHAEYGFCLPNVESGKSDGKALSKIAKLVDDQIRDGEVIIHYSGPYFRNLSFFPSIYYHKRSLPEYIYSAQPIPHWAGGQYLLPGEWIRFLSDLKPAPSGIWMISLNPTEHFFDDEVQKGMNKKWKWVLAENLPGELMEKDYIKEAAYQRGTVSAIHFVKRAQGDNFDG